MRAQQKYAKYEQFNGIQQKASGGDQYNRGLKPFGQSHDFGFVEFVGKLPAGGGENNEGEDEQCRNQIDEQTRGKAAAKRIVVGDCKRNRKFQKVVVERAEKLRPEECTKTIVTNQFNCHAFSIAQKILNE